LFAGKGPLAKSVRVEVDEEAEENIEERADNEVKRIFKEYYNDLFMKCNQQRHIIYVHKDLDDEMI